MTSEPAFALFGILDPLWFAIDGAGSFLPPLARLMMWGALAGWLSILLYKMISPQARLSALCSETKGIKQTLKVMDTNDEAYKTLIFKALSMNFRRFGMSLIPALISALPVLLLVTFLDAQYGLTKPEPGQPVAILAESGSDINPGQGQKFSKGWVISWPHPENSVTVRDADGNDILQITSTTQVGVASKAGLMRYLFGAPAGALPPKSRVESVFLESTPRDLIQSNLVFPYQWTIPFFLAVVMASLGIKFTMRIS